MTDPRADIESGKRSLRRTARTHLSAPPTTALPKPLHRYASSISSYAQEIEAWVPSRVSARCSGHGRTAESDIIPLARLHPRRSSSSYMIASFACEFTGFRRRFTHTHVPGGTANCR